MRLCAQVLRLLVETTYRGSAALDDAKRELVATPAWRDTFPDDALARALLDQVTEDVAMDAWMHVQRQRSLVDAAMEGVLRGRRSSDGTSRGVGADTALFRT